VNVRTAATAVAQAKAIDAWWRSNRLAAPDLFADELAQATALIADLPKAGRVTRRSGLPGIRYILLRSTRYHVFYTVDDAGILILSIWSAVRGTGPDLRAALRRPNP
jgi:plasmid stabilization system protein ParE